MSVIKVNKDNFENEVLKSEGKVLVDFNASWCGPCRMLGPVLEELSQEVKNVKIVSIDVDEEGILAQEYGVSSIPCLVLFEKGKEVNRSVGFIPKDNVKSFIGE